jgi:hypothetical protein
VLAGVRTALATLWFRGAPLIDNGVWTHIVHRISWDRRRKQWRVTAWVPPSGQYSIISGGIVQLDWARGRVVLVEG